MSHQIASFFEQNGDQENREYVADLEFDNFDKAAISIYDALGALDAYKGWSGNGVYAPFSLKTIEDGINLLRKRGDDHYIDLARQKSEHEDEVVARLSLMDVEVENEDQYTSINRSIFFLQKTLNEMIERGADTIFISFD